MEEEISKVKELLQMKLIQEHEAEARIAAIKAKHTEAAKKKREEEEARYEFPHHPGDSARPPGGWND